MAKTIWFCFILSTFSLALFGQMKPHWIRGFDREDNYPQKFFFTGYIEGNVRQGETVADAKKRLLKDAQGLLTENIRVTVKSQTSLQTVSTRTNETERIDVVFASNVHTASEMEIVGIKTEPPYYDSETGIVHAFAYINRFELTGYHKSALAMNLTQAEGLLQTAQNLETSGEKTKAREQCETAKTLLAKVRTAQEILTAIDPGGDLQQVRTEALHNMLAQMQAQLAQAVYVYMESAESNFSKPTTILANRLKSTLSGKGCSFTENPEQADYRINIEATTRHHNTEYGFATCFADVAIRLFDTRKAKTVFQDEFSQKGISTSQEAAGRKALEDAVPVIVDKISTWIQ